MARKANTANTATLAAIARLADAAEAQAPALALANSLDIGTSLAVNTDNVRRGVAALRAYAREAAGGAPPAPANGTAIHSCYGDPSFALLGLCLGPAMLAADGRAPLLIHIPQMLPRYREQFARLLPSIGNAAMTESGKEFFGKAISDSQIQNLVVFGDDWIERHHAAIAAAGKRLVFFGPGNNTAVVTPGADLAKAARSIAGMATILSGQAAVCAKRVVVDSRADYGTFLALLKEALLGAAVGDDPRHCDVTPIPAPLADAALKLAAPHDTWNLSRRDTPAGVLLTPALALEPAAESEIWRHYNFAPMLSIKRCAPSDIVPTISRNDYPIAAFLYGPATETAALKQRLAPGHAFVFENRTFLELLDAPGGYTGGWGGHGKGGHLLGPETGNRPQGGLVDIAAALARPAGR